MRGSLGRLPRAVREWFGDTEIRRRIQAPQMPVGLELDIQFDTLRETAASERWSSEQRTGILTRRKTSEWKKARKETETRKGALFFNGEVSQFFRRART